MKLQALTNNTLLLGGQSPNQVDAGTIAYPNAWPWTVTKSPVAYLEIVGRATGVTTLQDLWSQNTTRTLQTVALPLFAISTSANDTAAGTGAQTISVDTLDATYLPYTDTVTLAGLTPVQVGTSNRFRTNDLRVSTAGTGNQNAGAVYIFNPTGNSNGVAGSVVVTTPGTAAVAEKINIAISGTAVGSANCTILIRGISVTVFLHDLTSVNTIAADIRAGFWPGWTTGGTGANVTFTANTVGVQSGTSSFTMATPTGTAAAITTPVVGAVAQSEIIHIVVSGTAVGDGELDIVIRGAAPVPIKILDGYTASNTGDAIRAATFAGWTLTGSGATVIFTATVAGAKTGANSFKAVTTSGISAGITVTTPGVNAIAEVLNLAIAGIGATTGSVNIGVRGAAPVNVVITNGDSADTISANIRAATFAGWTTGGTGDNITLTATVAGLKTGANTFTLVTTTGVIGTFTIPTTGANAVAEVITYVMSGTALGDGSADVVIRGAVPVSIGIANGASSSTVAGSIRAATFTGWTLSGSASTAIFTATVAGAKTGTNSFTLSTTSGITGAITTPTPGLDATKEVIQYAITGTSVNTGYAAVVIRSGTAVDITLPSGTDAVHAALLIKAGTFSGWTTSVNGANVLFTATSTGVQSGTNSFTLYASPNITGTITTPTSGAVATAEVLTYTVSAAASANGFALVQANSKAFVVALLSTDTTVNGVATKLRAATYTGWTVTGSGATLILTSTTLGALGGVNALYSTTATPAAGSIQAVADIGLNRTIQAMYTVPKGMTLLIHNVQASVTDTTTTARAGYVQLAYTTTDGIYSTFIVGSVTTSVSTSKEFKNGVSIPQGAEVKFQCAMSGSAVLTFFADAELYPNTVGAL